MKNSLIIHTHMSTIKTKIQTRMRDLHKAMIALHEEGNTQAFIEGNIAWNTLDWVLEIIEKEENQAVETVVRADKYVAPYSGRD